MHGKNFVSSQKHFLKQYTCYSFNGVFNEENQPFRRVNIKFRNSDHFGGSQLPTSKVDNFSEKQTLYLFKWSFKDKIFMDIFKLRSQRFMRVEMNCRPMFIEIVNEIIYIIGGGQLYIIPMNLSSAQIMCNLGKQEIIDMCPGMTDDKKSGILIYSWNNSLGYQKRFYSSESHETNGWFQGIREGLLKIQRKQLQKGVLKVVIPNILGIMFHSNNQFSLMDLHQMEILPSSRTSLTQWSIEKLNEINIKYKQNQCSEGDDESLLISIGCGRNVQLFVLHMQYKADVKEFSEQRNLKIPKLTEAANNLSVNWSNIVLLPFLNFSLENELLDYQLLMRGIIYFCQNPKGNKIPIGNYIQYLNPTLISPILALENNIWRQFVTDSFLRKKEGILNRNRLLIPNRYSIPFVKYSTNESRLAQLKYENPQKIICDWSRLYQFRKIIKYNNQVLIIRDSSISTFLQIEELQYNKQRQDNKDNTDIWNMVSDSRSRISIGTNSVEESGEESAQNGMYFHYNCLIQNKKQQQFFCEEEQRPILKFLTNIDQRHITDLQNHISVKEQVFSFQLLTNYIKDMLSYYEFTLKKHFYKKSDEGINNENFEFEKLIIYYLTVFNKINNEPYEQFEAHGKDIFSIFIQHYFQSQHFTENSLINIQQETWKVLQELFLNLLPIQIPSSSKSKQNKFINMLISHYNISYQYAENILFSLINTPQYIPVHFNLPILQVHFILNLQFYKLQDYLRSFLLQIRSRSPTEVNVFLNWLRNSYIKKQFQSFIKAEVLKMGLYSPEISQAQEPTEAKVQKFNDSMMHIQEKTTQRAVIEDLVEDLEKTVISIQKYPNQNELADFEDGQLQSFFYKHLQFSVTSKPLENILEGWGLYYKSYAQKLTLLLKEQSLKGQVSPVGRRKSLNYLNKCEKSLKNFMQYYQQIYKVKKSEQYYLTSHLGNFLLSGKLMTRDWMQIIRTNLNFEQNIPVPSSENILFTQLANLFEKGMEMDIIPNLKKLKKYFSIRQMGNMVIENTQLRQKYEHQKEAVRVFFGYSEVNRIIKFDPQIYQSLKCRNPNSQALLGISGN